MEIIGRDIKFASNFGQILVTRLISTIQPSFNSNYRNTREKGKCADIHIHFFHSVCQTLGKNVRKLPKEKEEELKQHFTGSFVDQAKAFDQYLSVVPEAMVAVAHGVTAMHDVTEGGIYGALWELAEASGVGLEIDLKAIPIRQETVEVCEQFHLNPYQLISSGSMLMAAPDGLGLVQALKKAGIPASIVGRCVEGKAKKIVNGEDTAYLERPKTDELYKIYE